MNSILIRSIFELPICYTMPNGDKVTIQGRNSCPLRVSKDTRILEEQWEIIASKYKNTAVISKELIYAVSGSVKSVLEEQDTEGRGIETQIDKVIPKKKK